MPTSRTTQNQPAGSAAGLLGAVSVAIVLAVRRPPSRALTPAVASVR